MFKAILADHCFRAGLSTIENSVAVGTFQALSSHIAIILDSLLQDISITMESSMEQHCSRQMRRTELRSDLFNAILLVSGRIKTCCPGFVTVNLVLFFILIPGEYGFCLNRRIEISHLRDSSECHFHPAQQRAHSNILLKCSLIRCQPWLP